MYMDRNQYTVRDLLAFDRTYLANERTFLSYIRTFVGLEGAGAALLKLFDVSWTRTAAVFLLCAGPVLLIVGFIRFVRTKKRLDNY